MLSITTTVLGSSGTACMMPSSSSLGSPGQKANSERWTLLKLSDRPMPPLPAVAQRILLRRPGFRRFSPSSRVGFSKRSSLALDAFRMGCSAGGRQSKKSLFILKRVAVDSALWATMRVETMGLVAAS